jgi:hypothetical protein
VHAPLTVNRPRDTCRRRRLVVAGILSVSVQPTATLPAATAGSATLRGQLGTVLVTDTRTPSTTWSASSTSTTFVGSTGSVSTGVTYNAGAFALTGGPITMAPALTVSLRDTAAVVVRATSVSGKNTASWNPTLTVSLPSDALAGVYTGTINTSVS